MATLEDEIKDLKEKNNELVQKVQYWKMTAADRENDKLNLMKEMNELRLKLSRLRNNGGFERAQKLDAALQQASEKAISHLVKASAEIAKSMEITKAYIKDIQEYDVQSPRWSTIGDTPMSEKKNKVNRVRPMMRGGGRLLQPVVAIRRTLLNDYAPRTESTSPNQNHGITERAVPMRMLQDVYIPLTRIDSSHLPNNNMETDTEENDTDESSEDSEREDNEELLDESAPMSEDEDDDNEFSGRKLHALSEEDTEIEDNETPRLSLHLDNPLEGPSWLLDSPPDSRSSNAKRGANLEPDSTTELDKTPNTPYQKTDDVQKESSSGGGVSVRLSCEFSPTVRRRKRTSSPPSTTPRQHQYSPRPVSSRKNSMCGRVLKVLVAKMRLDGEPGGGEGGSPPKRARSPSRDPLLTFDAPSPNGATDAGVIVSESRTRPLDKDIKTEPGTSQTQSRRESQDSRVRRESHDSRARLNSQDHRDDDQIHEPIEQECTNVRSRLNSHESHARSRVMSQDRDSVQRSRVGSHDSRDSDSGSGGGGDSINEGRTRRARKMVTYKEKPLNRKLRR